MDLFQQRHDASQPHHHFNVKEILEVGQICYCHGMQVIMRFYHQSFLLCKNSLSKRQHGNPPSFYIIKQFQTLGFKQLGKNSMHSKCLLNEDEKYVYIVYNNPSSLPTKG
jgi:hypothetical protein